jgi:hypothetical protein
MALNINKIKAKLNSLNNTNQKSNLLWKPSPGKAEIRIVPYKFQLDNPFSELKFHYNINGKTYLSPDSFGRPDPIVEFANRLKRSGDKEEWKMARKLEPKMRTFAPIIVRGEEQEGVKFWGFGKQVYQELLSIISDPDYGDITDLGNGRDIVVEFKTAEDSGKQFPETSIRVKPNTKPAVDPSDKELLAKISNQSNLLDLFNEPTYDELKSVMDAWLNPDGSPIDVSSDVGVDSTPVEVSSPVNVGTTVPTTPSVVPTTPKVVNTNDAAAAFDKLFNNQ